MSNTNPWYWVTFTLNNRPNTVGLGKLAYEDGLRDGIEFLSVYEGTMSQILRLADIRDKKGVSESDLARLKKIV